MKHLLIYILLCLASAITWAQEGQWYYSPRGDNQVQSFDAIPEFNTPPISQEKLINEQKKTELAHILQEDFYYYIQTCHIQAYSKTRQFSYTISLHSDHFFQKLSSTYAREYQANLAYAKLNDKSEPEHYLFEIEISATVSLQENSNNVQSLLQVTALSPRKKRQKQNHFKPIGTFISTLRHDSPFINTEVSLHDQNSPLFRNSEYKILHVKLECTPE